MSKQSRLTQKDQKHSNSLRLSVWKRPFQRLHRIPAPIYPRSTLVRGGALPKLGVSWKTTVLTPLGVASAAADESYCAYIPHPIFDNGTRMRTFGPGALSTPYVYRRKTEDLFTLFCQCPRLSVLSLRLTFQPGLKTRNNETLKFDVLRHWNLAICRNTSRLSLYLISQFPSTCSFRFPSLPQTACSRLSEHRRCTGRER